MHYDSLLSTAIPCLAFTYFNNSVAIGSLVGSLVLVVVLLHVFSLCDLCHLTTYLSGLLGCFYTRIVLSIFKILNCGCCPYFVGVLTLSVITASYYFYHSIFAMINPIVKYLVLFKLIEKWTQYSCRIMVVRHGEDWMNSLHESGIIPCRAASRDASNAVGKVIQSHDGRISNNNAPPFHT